MKRGRVWLDEHIVDDGNTQSKKVRDVSYCGISVVEHDEKKKTQVKKLCRSLPPDVVIYAIMPYVEPCITIQGMKNNHTISPRSMLQMMYGYFWFDEKRTLYPVFTSVKVVFSEESTNSLVTNSMLFTPLHMFDDVMMMSGSSIQLSQNWDRPFSDFGFAPLEQKRPDFEYTEFHPFWGRVQKLSFARDQSSVSQDTIVSLLKKILFNGKPKRLKFLFLPNFFTQRCFDLILDYLKTDSYTQRSLIGIETVELSLETVAEFLKLCPVLQSLCFPLDHRLWYYSPEAEIVTKSSEETSLTGLADIVAKHQYLQVLTLGNCWGFPGNKLFQNEHQLQDLSFYNVNTSTLMELSGYVNTRIRRLAVDANDSAANVILKLAPNLRELLVVTSAFQANPLTGVGVSLLAKSNVKKLVFKSVARFKDVCCNELMKNESLEDLTFMDCSVTKVGIKYLLCSKQKSALKKLTISHMRTKENAFASLPPLCSIEELTLSQTRLSPKDIVYLLTQAKLKTVRIHLIGAGEPGHDSSVMNEFFNMCGNYKNQTLIHLSISGCTLTNEQILKLHEVFQTLHTLHLPLANCDYHAISPIFDRSARLCELGDYTRREGENSFTLLHSLLASRFIGYYEPSPDLIIFYR